jgi:hypothetical protein
MPPEPEDDWSIIHWRELGFYYDLQDSPVKWLFFGSKRGLRQLVRLMREYADDPKNEEISGHEHYGPYGSLEIMTWHHPNIDGHAISGTRGDIKNLAKLIESKLDTAKVGDRFSIGADYSTNSGGELEFFIKDDNFDPSSLDTSISRIAE